MEPYTVDGLAKIEGERIGVNSDDESDDEGDKKTNQCTKYSLAGVVIHNGNASGSQYYSFMKRRFSFLKCCVLLFNLLLVLGWAKERLSGTNLKTMRCPKLSWRTTRFLCLEKEMPTAHWFYLGIESSMLRWRICRRDLRPSYEKHAVSSPETLLERLYATLRTGRFALYQFGSSHLISTHDESLFSFAEAVSNDAGKLPGAIERGIQKENLKFVHLKALFSIEHFRFMRSLVDSVVPLTVVEPMVTESDIDFSTV